MREFTIFILVYFVLFGAIGMAIGQRKGRTLAGLVWAMILGPLGWLVVALGPNLGGPKTDKCPHCAGIVPVGQPKCNHCGNGVTWTRERALKPSRAA